AVVLRGPVASSCRSWSRLQRGPASMTCRSSCAATSRPALAASATKSTGTNAARRLSPRRSWRRICWWPWSPGS
ncbi:unnamed protein product, partial [Effrenium voratum]